MIGIFRSQWVMACCVVAASLTALNLAFGTLAYAILSGPSSVTTFRDLAIAAGWLFFSASVVLLAGVAGALWFLIMMRSWVPAWEAASTTVGAVLVAIGLLLRAIGEPRPPEAAKIVTAVGVGIWAILAVVVAGRIAIDAERERAARSDLASTWGIAAAALLIVAVSFGLPTGSVQDKGPLIADNVVGAIGFVFLAVAIGFGRAHRLLTRSGLVVGGLLTVAAGSAATAIVAGIVVHPGLNLAAFRIGFSLATAISAVGMIPLAAAAWRRLQELAAHEPAIVGYSSNMAGEQHAQSPPAASDAQPRSEHLPASGGYAPPSGWYEVSPGVMQWWDGSEWTARHGSPAAGEDSM